MQHRTFHGQLATAIIAFVLTSTGGLAQAPPQRHSTVLQIQGLTSTMRDGLSQDLRRDGHFRIAFACVPAGILVLEPIGTDRRQSAETAVLPLVQQRIAPSAIRTTTMDRTAAEAQCAQARNR